VTVDTLHQRWLVLMLRNELQAPCPLAVTICITRRRRCVPVDSLCHGRGPTSRPTGRSRHTTARAAIGCAV